jgi:hypothetical protein
MRIFQPIVSGSLTVTGGITGSLLGTSSYALTASYVFNAGVIASNGGLTSSLYSTSPPAYVTTNDGQILLGFNAGYLSSDAFDLISLGTNAGYNAQIAYRSVFLGTQAGFNAISANNSNFIGYQAGEGATNAGNANFIGQLAGYNAPYANNSTFLGYGAGFEATTAQSSNFFGNLAGSGATNAYGSNFFGYNAGNQSKYANNSNFLGENVGRYQNSASYSTFLGYQAGDAAENNVFLGKNNIIIGTNITLPAGTKDSINLGGIIFATGSYSDSSSSSPTALPQYGIGRVGINKVSPNYTLDVSGSGNYSNGLTVTGSIVATSFTGSLQGTSSWATKAITASYALNAGGGTPGGSTGQIQWNRDGIFDGVSTLTYDGTTLKGTGSFAGSFSGSLYIAGTSASATVPVLIAVSSGSSSDVRYSQNGLTYTVSTNRLNANLQGNVVGTVTGDLIGTASWATNALTASFAPNYLTTGSSGGTQTISGSLVINQNLTVLGTSSIQYVSSSQLNIGTNLITVNTATPAVRFGGLAVADSGSSPIRSGSLLFDSTNDQWIFTHQAISGSAVTSSVLIMGPETYGNIGNETNLTTNRIPKSVNAEHIGDSNITDTGTSVSINSNTLITGSLNVSAGITGSFTGSLVGIATTASYVTGSVHNSTNPALSASYALTASYAMNAGSGGTVSTASLLTTASATSNVITFTKGDASTFTVTVATGSGGGGAAFPYTGSAGISGSLLVNGKVGIGVTSPGYDLDVSGSLRLIGTSSPNIIIKNPNASISNGLLGQLALTDSGDVTKYDLTFIKSSSGRYNMILGVGGNNNTIIGDPGSYFYDAGYRLDIVTPSTSGALRVNGNSTITGSLGVSSGITGSLQGTSSYAITASYALVSSGTISNAVSASYANYAVTASYVIGGGLSGGTADYIPLWTGVSSLSTSSIYESGSNIGVGTISPTAKLYILSSDAKVAHFEGAYGYPIQILTTSGSLTVGYSASLGSIGNGDGTLYVKTGSSAPDWAPIAYDNHLVQSTQYGIDLSTGDFTIPGPGIYELVSGASNDLIFPDPDSFIGQRIVVINTDASNQASIDNTNTYAPYSAGSTTQLSIIDTEQMWEFMSIHSKWRGVKPGK